jgi:hypothetical protein
MRTTVPLALAIALLALPAAAGAATVRVDGASSNVNSAACGVGGQTACKTIQIGATRAQNLGTADQIAVAPGTYPETVTVSGMGDSIAGAGSCAQPATCTVLAPGLSSTAVIDLFGDGSAVSGVRIVAASNANRIGLTAPGDDTRATDVFVDMNAANSVQPAVRLDGAGTVVLDRVSVFNDGDGQGIYAGTMSAFVLTDSLVQTPSRTPVELGPVGTTTIRRTRLLELTPGSGFQGYLIGGGSAAGPIRVESSLITGGTVGVGIGSPVTVVGSTIDPGAAGGSDGSPVSTDQAGSDPTTVRDSLLLGRPYTVGGGPLTCTTTDTGTVIGPFGPTCVAGPNGNTTSAATALFADVAGGDYRLKAGSPAVDTTSTTALEAGEATDIAGAARVLDGNGDCVARRDRGAYELTGFAAACPAVVPPAAPPAQPVARDLVKPRIGRLAGSRTRIRFGLSEAAKVSVGVERKGKKGKRTVYRKVGSFAVATGKAGSNSAKVPAKLAKSLKKPAAYRVTLVATDAAGNRSAQARDSFTVKPPKKKKRRRR